MVELTLSPIEQRILGALMEKQVTVPTTYPPSLNALRTACNQTSSRDPVTAYEDRELEHSARELKHRELIRVVVADRGQRTLKYHQRLVEHLELADDERAVLTVLLLRGPNAPGELRSRTERLHVFADRAAVEQVLARLAKRGLVKELPRRPGQHDNRWVHLLGPVESEQPAGQAAGEAPATAVDREVVLAHGASARDARVRAGYDAAAQTYGDAREAAWAERLFDRWLIDRVAESAEGPIADVGCGAGVLTAHMAAWDAEVVGYDLAPAMIAQARRRYPGLSFEVGDLRRLLRPPTAGGWGAIVAWYSLGHLAPSELTDAFAALGRVLNPRGTLALALHVGDDVRHEVELAGAEVDMELVLHDPGQVREALAAAGLSITEWYLRGPKPGEFPADCYYVLARRPEG